MKIKATRDSLKVIPENKQEVAFLEDTIGVKNYGDSVSFRKVKNEWENPFFGYVQDTEYIIGGGNNG